MGEAGLGAALDPRVGVLPQHAQQPPHLGQGGARRVADGEQAGGALGREPRGGEAGGLRLDGDHRDVMRDDIVQLPCDTSPFTPGGMFEEGVREGLFRRAVRLCRAAYVVGDAGGRGGGGEGRDEDGDDPGRFFLTAEGDHDVGQDEQSAEAGGSGAAQHVDAHQLGHDPADGEDAEGHEGQHAGRTDGDSGTAARGATGPQYEGEGQGGSEGEQQEDGEPSAQVGAAQQHFGERENTQDTRGDEIPRPASLHSHPLIVPTPVRPGVPRARDLPGVTTHRTGRP